MKLKAWLDGERGRSTRMAQALNVPPSFVTKMATGERPVPVNHMAAIEVVTGGEVTRQDLCPDEWRRIWPELAATVDAAQPQGA